jgi:cell division protein FtsB
VKSVLKKILKVLLNKYFLTIVAFGVWILFFDTNNIIIRNKMQQKLDELNQEKKFYLDEIRADSTLTKQLMTDSAWLEKFAREKYLMKKDNEDLFLVVDTTADQRR